MTFLADWGPVILHMALIFIVSASSDPGQLPEHMSDKIAHLAVYAVLGFLILRALSRARQPSITWQRIVVAIAVSILYGISDELHQMMVPGRTPDVMDVVADALGAALGAAALASFKVLRRVYFEGSRSARFRD